MAQIEHNLEEFLIARLEGKTLAVVGNGPITGEYGEEIDGHDEVMRFGKYTTKGYEEGVGEKTTIWVRGSSETQNRYKHEMSINPRIVDVVHYKMNGAKVIDPSTDYQKQIYETMGGRMASASTGILLLYMLDKLCIAADVYNFDFMDGGVYFSEVGSDDVIHSAETEKRIAQTLRFARFADQDGADCQR